MLYKMYAIFIVMLHDNSTNIHSSFIAKVRFFQDIGVREDAIGNMLVKFPSLLTYSLYRKIRPVVCSFLTSLPLPPPPPPPPPHPHSKRKKTNVYTILWGISIWQKAVKNIRDIS